VGCAACRDAVSATLDGESPGVPLRWVDDHLAGCVACRSWSEAAAEVTRRARLVAAPPVPDVTAAVLGRLPAGRSRRRWNGADAVLRLALLAVAWNLGLAACFLVVAVLPRLAAGALPFLLSFTAVLAWVTLGDLGAGHVHAGRAVDHLLLVGGALLVSALALRNRAPRTGPARRRLPRLRSPSAWWTALRPRSGAGPVTAGQQLHAAVPQLLRADPGGERAAA
jgi:predicted anti-sigma-YlaC factor YlaD